MILYPRADYAQVSQPSHPIFKYVESRFWAWLERAPRDFRDMYLSEEAIYSRKGAIQAAISNAIEEAEETKKPVDLIRFDIECAFE